MRRSGGIAAINAAIEKLSRVHAEHIAVYGAGNEARLTGKHETCDISMFKSGVADRGCSIRVPRHVQLAGQGYLEDRRVRIASQRGLRLRDAYTTCLVSVAAGRKCVPLHGVRCAHQHHHKVVSPAAAQCAAFFFCAHATHTHT